MELNTWTEDPSGLDLDAGQVGGDIQWTDSVSRRWIKPLDDGTYAMVTVTAYGTRDWDQHHEKYMLDVQAQVEWMRCRDWQDPGGTQLDADYTYDYPFDFAPEGQATAYDWAKQHVISYDIERDISWDGVSAIQH